jgi:hypothetical protein
MHKLAESFNKPRMKAVRAACTRVEDKSWKQELYKFLKQYRFTPHSSTKIKPFRLLFARAPRTKLLEMDGIRNEVDQQARSNDQMAHERKMKIYADERNHAKHRERIQYRRPGPYQASEEEK